MNTLNMLFLAGTILAFLVFALTLARYARLGRGPDASENPRNPAGTADR